MLLPDRAGRSVVEPRALRRRPLRLPRRRRGDDLTELYERTRDEGFGDEPKRRILLGTYALSAGYYDAYYGQAQKVRTIIIREHAELFERFDVLVSPTSPTVAFKLGEKTADPLAMYLADVLDDPAEHGRASGPRASRAGSAKRCPSACSWSARSSPRTRCSGSRTHSSARSASTPSRSACDEAIVDPAADFVPACRRASATSRVLDGARADSRGDVKLALEAGERELWLIEMRGPLEHRVGMVEVEGDIERALHEVKELLVA